MKKMDEFAANGCTPHPKMEKLKDILVKYFGSRIRGPNEEGAGEPDDSRVMVFSSYRAVVEEIIVELNQHRPLVRAAAFVGQARSQDGTKGLTQKQQTEVGSKNFAMRHNVDISFSLSNASSEVNSMFSSLHRSVKRVWTLEKSTARSVMTRTRRRFGW